jgi:hypothetical protein
MGLKSKPLDLVRDDVPVGEVTKEEMVRVNINVPDSTRQAWKLASVTARKPVTDMIIEAMSAYLYTHKLK